MNPQGRRGGAALFIALLAGPLAAQSPEYAGTWKLNREASQIAAPVGLTPLGAGGAPPMLYVTQAANGTVVVGSDINESGAQLYRLIPGKGFTADRAGVREQFSLSPDGKTLTVRISSGSGMTTLVYARTQTAEPCESWPTPCRW